MWKIGRGWIAAWSSVVLLGVVASGWAGTPPGAEEAATAAATEEVGGAPRIEFTTMEHDFGTADAGPELKTTFAFKNAGEGVLVIEKVKGG